MSRYKETNMRRGRDDVAEEAEEVQAVNGKGEQRLEGGKGLGWCGLCWVWLRDGVSEGRMRLSVVVVM